MDHTPLFSADLPQCLGRAALDETTFQFLERGGRPECAPARDRVEELFSLWGGDKDKLRSKLCKKRKNDQFDGAFSEMLVNGVLLRSGYQVEHEREIPGGRTPDFRCHDESEKFYVETTAHEGRSGRTPRERNFERRLRDAVNRDPEPPCLMAIQSDGDMPEDARHKAMAHQIRTKANALAKSSVAKTASLRFPNERGWLVVDFYLSETNVRGIHIGGIGQREWVSGNQHIRNVLAKKAKKYRAADDPLFLAINVHRSDAVMSSDHGSHLGALYGDESRSEGPFVPNLSSVEGVLVFGGMGSAFGGASPWSLHSTHVRLYMNGDTQPPRGLHHLLTVFTVAQALNLDA